MAASRERVPPLAGHRADPVHARDLTGGGTSGNERLTTATGAVLLVLLAVLGVTIVRIGQLLSVHLFVGMLLIPPVLLKLASTGYRFIHYYAGSARYREKGPPAWPLRVIAPVTVLSTLLVFASGVVLLFVGPSSRATWFPIHKITFFVWLGFIAIHVLGHLPAMASVLRADYGRPLEGYLGPADRSGRAGRVLALSSALVLGVVLAILVIPEFGSWLHNAGLFHHHH